jgi:hypothetical protein
MRCRCVGANDPDGSDAVTSDDVEQASAPVLAALPPFPHDPGILQGGTSYLLTLPYTQEVLPAL